MNKSANGNMYEVTLNEMHELFRPHLHGNTSGLVCVVSDFALEGDAQSALESAMATRSYGRGACTFATLHPHAADEGASLDAGALFLLLEGLDPLCIVAADEASVSMLEQAYRLSLPLDAHGRLLGRNAVAFRSFTAMLKNNRTKQTAWALLKKLPKFGEH